MSVKAVIDTNALMTVDYIKNLNTFIEENELIVPMIVVEELDNHNHGSNEARKYKARMGLKFLKDNRDKIKFVTEYDVIDGLDESKPDNKIISVAKTENAKLITMDLTMILIAEQYGVETLNIDSDDDSDDVYKGYKILELDNSTEEGQQALADLYEKPEINAYNLFPNQYLIIRDLSFPNYDADKDEFKGFTTIEILKWNGEKYIKLKQPPKKVVKPMNDLQKCALDLLMDKSVPIKIITGTYGSGKTLCATRVGVHLVEDKGDYGTLFMVRNPVGSGEEIGFLPGSKTDKIRDFFKPIMQHFPGSEFQVEDMFRKGSLDMEVPFYMKGLSIGQAYIVCDESEDLNAKTIKLIGSRLEEDSCIVFCGDHKQAEKQFIYDNGLLHLSRMTKANPLVGTVTLDLDVRSDASKVFADL